jgi:hypothetical protein
MVFCAASWAALTTKSPTERPWISAARRTTARAPRVYAPPGGRSCFAELASDRLLQ